MEFLTDQQFKVLANPGVTSTQLLSPHNSLSERVTITRVVVEPGHTQPRHLHESSEQIWIAISGSGTLLLESENTLEIHEGQVVRFADGDMHGFTNSGSSPFVYISVTSPPINFSYAYKGA
ncbi:cupin domain-containing protein [Chitinimonas sp. BJYL2]|uniref:cupin domain-containing protein n=1 Tax=Chitinimonas sp. BJYL2 TaxID=2976696 RepID=UPI0022B40A4E|nr:cupin domain-containing protein [Chitinimonas sp. BJYL2]